MGESRFSTSARSDWPKSLWKFPLADDVIPSNEGTFPVAVVIGERREEVTLGRCDGCWVGGCGPVFGSAHTAATWSVLAAELESCQELLLMEPDNKCTHAHTHLTLYRVCVCVCVCCRVHFDHTSAPTSSGLAQQRWTDCEDVRQTLRGGQLSPRLLSGHA